MNRRHTLLAIAAAAASLAACSRPADKPAFRAIDITGAEYARKLELPDAEGKPRTLADFAGKVTVVFFGYTQCPDVCPSTMAELAEVKRSLGADGARVQGVFVSVDPERDTPELLRAYMSGFDPSFVALRGTPEQTAAAAREFKVFYSKVPAKDGHEKNYTVDHTAGSYVFDPKGRVRLFVRYGSGAQALADDLKILLNEGA